MTPHYVFLANPGSKRWQSYAHDLAAYWQDRRITPDVHVLPWTDIVHRTGNLDDFPGLDRPAVVRLESPGRDFEVTKLLLQAGDGNDWHDQPYRKGQLLHPGLLHRGFCRVLSGLKTALEQRPWLKPQACPLAVAELFDKRATAARLHAAHIPVPATLPPAANGAALIEYLCSRPYRTVYVKLNTGSSATGIVVLHPRDDPPWAITSMIRLEHGYFNTRRLQCIRGSELEAALDYLLVEGAFVQEGIPMAQIDGQNFDVRVVVLYGEPRFFIFRLSQHPMTNLHLGGRRGQPEVCRAAIPTRAWLDAIDHCVEAARLYPCAMVGIDLLFARNYLRHVLLEINAFGDFFPGLVDEHGVTVHRAEIERTARMFFGSA